MRYFAAFLYITQAVGILFVGVFLAAYLAGLPTTTVLHSDPAIRLSLAALGSVLLILLFLNIIFSIFFGWRVKSETFVTHIKIGLLIVLASYFLFTLHAAFTLSWVGEWERFKGLVRFVILVEDFSGFFGIVFRLAASFIVLVLTVFWLRRKNPPKPSTFKFLRVFLVFEGVYWLGLFATAFFSVLGFLRLISRNGQILPIINSLVFRVIPTILESVILPLSFFILASKLSPNKPIKQAIKWGLITGTIMIAVFWLVNTSIWINVLNTKGTDYLTAYPEHILSFMLTTIGLAALTFYTICFAKKTCGIENIHTLKIRTIGGIVSALGTYFLWNYMSWVLLAGDTWNNWYAWLLGHNLDLWMLSLPLIGLPLLFYEDAIKSNC